jgi:hypothetical protein
VVTPDLIYRRKPINVGLTGLAQRRRRYLHAFGSGSAGDDYKGNIVIVHEISEPRLLSTPRLIIEYVRRYSSYDHDFPFIQVQILRYLLPGIHILHNFTTFIPHKLVCFISKEKV